MIATARKLGYYQIECDARLALGELEIRLSPEAARAQLATLATETRSRGLELLARQAERAVTNTARSVVAFNRPAR
ncbi:MAG: hypothetical protein WBV36_18610 [Terriglobales bacterium]